MFGVQDFFWQPKKPNLLLASSDGRSPVESLEMEREVVTQRNYKIIMIKQQAGPEGRPKDEGQCISVLIALLNGA